MVSQLLGGSYFSGYVAAHQSKEVIMSADSVYRVTDSESNVEGSLTVLRECDGGASAVVVELRNPSHDYNVVLKVNTDMSAFIMLTVTDEQGTVLSKPARKFNTSEEQQFDIVRIGCASSHRWRVPIAAQINTSEIPKQDMKGRLVVNVSLLFSKLSCDEKAADAHFNISVLTLYDMDILFTQAALSEGTEPPTADH
jgi:hypothetical protein